MHSKESSWISEKDPHCGIQIQHIRWNPTFIHPCLYIEVLKYNALHATQVTLHHTN